MGGARNAAARMSHSSRAAGKMLAFARTVQEKGLQEAAREFGIPDLTGKPIGEALPLLTEAFCEPGGGLDEGVTSRAWSETILSILESGIADLNAITNPQHWQAIIEKFIAESICQRIYNDIGNKTIAVAQDVKAINEMSQQVSDIVSGSVAARVAPLLVGNNRQPGVAFQAEIDGIYQLAFNYLVALNAEE
jgi:hypothetical protein